MKFTHANTSFYLMTEAGIEARRQVARNLTPDTTRRLQTAPTSDSRDFSLMQELADAGFSANELKAAGFSITELKGAGFSAAYLGPFFGKRLTRYNARGVQGQEVG